RTSTETSFESRLASEWIQSRKRRKAAANSLASPSLAFSVTATSSQTRGGSQRRQQGGSDRYAEAGARVPARSGAVGAVAARGEPRRRGGGRPGAGPGMQGLRRQAGVRPRGLREPGGERGKQRRDGAGPADHRPLPVDQHLISGRRVRVAGDVGNAAAGSPG